MEQLEKKPPLIDGKAAEEKRTGTAKRKREQCNDENAETTVWTPHIMKRLSDNSKPFRYYYPPKHAADRDYEAFLLTAVLNMGSFANTPKVYHRVADFAAAQTCVTPFGQEVPYESVVPVDEICFDKVDNFCRTAYGLWTLPLSNTCLELNEWTDVLFVNYKMDDEDKTNCNLVINLPPEHRWIPILTVLENKLRDLIAVQFKDNPQILRNMRSYIFRKNQTSLSCRVKITSESKLQDVHSQTAISIPNLEDYNQRGRSLFASIKGLISVKYAWIKPSMGMGLCLHVDSALLCKRMPMRVLTYPSI